MKETDFYLKKHFTAYATPFEVINVK